MECTGVFGRRGNTLPLSSVNAAVSWRFLFHETREPWILLGFYQSHQIAFVFLALWEVAVGLVEEMVRQHVFTTMAVEAGKLVIETTSAKRALFSLFTIDLLSCMDGCDLSH